MSLSENVGGLLSLPAGSDLSTKKYYLVKINSSGLLAVAGAGEAAIGTLYETASASGSIAGVQPLVGRKQLGICGGTFTAGDLLASDASGKLVAATLAKVDTLSTGIAADPVISSNVVGVALEDGAASRIVQFLGLALGASPTTVA